jgi:predicted AlkP superfamily pyrophosphatase or phosphodiesterase
MAAALIAAALAGQRPEVPRVVVLGIDGLGSDNVWRDTFRGVPAPEIPNIDGLRQAGAYTLEARIDPLNFSGPNWMGMLTGSLSSEHGVDSNGCTRGRGLPTVFDVLHEAFERRTIASVYEWDRIGCYGEPPVVGRLETATERETADGVIAAMADDRLTFAFVHFERLDEAGHGHGGHSVEYKERIESIDGEIGRVLAVISSSAYADSTFVILTSDHGHRPGGGGHSSSDDPVPFIVTGPGVRPGVIDTEVRNNQVAPLVAHIFGIAPSPEWSAGIAPFDAIVTPYR